jgi:acetyl esterase/lipase
MSPPPALPPERTGRPAGADLAARRQGIAAAAASAVRTDPPASEVRLGGVRCLRIDPPGPARGLVLHFHGGGFRLGAPEMIAPFAAALAARCAVSVVCPAYRLAPEHPFPNGLHDARAAFLALSGEGAGPIILSGDSAGGGLAASLAALSIADERPPAGLIVLSPWLDLTLTSRDYEANAATDPLFSRASAEEAAGFYLQGAPADHPLASPLLGPVGGFPPTLVSYSLEEVLAGDGRRFHAKLLAAGARSRECALAGMEHVAVTRNMALRGSAETFAALCAFVDKVTGAA